ncbi:hypothetical protein LFT45_17090 [Arthrobacter sp. FW305-BF8]|uniref:hypothetical protein n=1 Tax=Arthrobacter sp. FW305-BF8 TaxID=2879617 RepID=UPI001F43318D|nr:hypothetical protein [Arthrobacter sp. FW305-BF8]UKA53421.1 hypothetical protein LFT45_17090 [Arthrobacter sp. FW305-BF8]
MKTGKPPSARSTELYASYNSALESLAAVPGGLEGETAKAQRHRDDNLKTAVSVARSDTARLDGIGQALAVSYENAATLLQREGGRLPLAVRPAFGRDGSATALEASVQAQTAAEARIRAELQAAARQKTQAAEAAAALRRRNELVNWQKAEALTARIEREREAAAKQARQRKYVRIAALLATLIVSIVLLFITNA